MKFLSLKKEDKSRRFADSFSKHRGGKFSEKSCDRIVKKQQPLKEKREKPLRKLSAFSKFV